MLKWHDADTHSPFNLLCLGLYTSKKLSLHPVSQALDPFDRTQADATVQRVDMARAYKAWPLPIIQKQSWRRDGNPKGPPQSAAKQLWPSGDAPVCEEGLAPGLAAQPMTKGGPWATTKRS